MSIIKLTVKTPQGLEEIERDSDNIDFIRPHLGGCEVYFVDGEYFYAMQEDTEIEKRIKESKRK